MKKTIIAILLLAAMLLSGCTLNPNAPASTTAPSDAPTEAAETSELPPATPVPLGIELFAIDGTPVYESEFRFWVNQTLSANYIDINSEIDWSQPGPDSILTLDLYIKSEAEKTARIYRTVILKAKELGITLSEDEEAQINGLRDEYLGYFGGDETEYDNFLANAGLTEELLKYTERVRILFGKIEEQLVGDGSGTTDEAAIKFGEDNEVLRAKHILITSSADDEKVVREAALLKAQAIYDELSAITDRDAFLARYDEIMQESSDDPGKISNPGGYQFIPGVMVEAFTVTTQSLDYYGMSAPVDIDYGYSVILRLPLDPDSSIMTGYDDAGTLRQIAGDVALQEQVNEWAESLTVATTPEYDNLDVPSFAVGK